MAIIFYELNEVPKKIFDYYSKSFPQSSFGRLSANAKSKFLTTAEDVGHLSPWVTWPTLHRGVTNQQHEISSIGQDLAAVNRDFPPVWDLVARQGNSVGVFGSLQSYPLPQEPRNFQFYVPDCFAGDDKCYPSELSGFQSFNLEMVKRSGRNVGKAIDLRTGVTFLLNSAKLGLTSASALKLAGQLMSERLDPNKVVRRRTSQAQIAFDLFFNALRQKRPELSFFFTNHVASAMHRYWPAIFPDDYETLQFDKEWLHTWKQEIPFALKEAASQLKRLMDFVDREREYTLIVASSMGQEAVQEVSKMTNQVLITNISKLMSTVGMSPADWQSRSNMHPLQVVTLRNPADMTKIMRLNNVIVNETKLTCAQVGPLDFELDIKLANQTKLYISLDDHPLNSNDVGIELIDLQDAAGSNAYHIPEGVCLVYDGKNRAPQSGKWTSISTLDIAPSILNHFSVAKPNHMKSGFTF